MLLSFWEYTDLDEVGFVVSVKSRLDDCFPCRRCLLDGFGDNFDDDLVKVLEDTSNFASDKSSDSEKDRVLLDFLMGLERLLDDEDADPLLTLECPFERLDDDRDLSFLSPPLPLLSSPDLDMLKFLALPLRPVVVRKTSRSLALWLRTTSLLLLLLPPIKPKFLVL